MPMVDVLDFAFVIQHSMQLEAHTLMHSCSICMYTYLCHTQGWNQANKHLNRLRVKINLLSTSLSPLFSFPGRDRKLCTGPAKWSSMLQFDRYANKLCRLDKFN